MAFPTVVAVNTSTTLNAVNHEVALPAGVSEGDLLIVLMGVDGGPVVTPPVGGGWTEILQRNGTTDTGLTATFGAWYKTAGSSESSPATFTTVTQEKSSHKSFRITGGELPDGSSTFLIDGSSADPNPPSHSATGGSADILWIAAAAIDGNSTISGWPYGTGNEQTISQGGSGNTMLAVDYKTAAAASEDPGVFDGSALVHWVAATIAVYPPAGEEPGAQPPFTSVLVSG